LRGARKGDSKKGSSSLKTNVYFNYWGGMREAEEGKPLEDRELMMVESQGRGNRDREDV